MNFGKTSMTSIPFHWTIEQGIFVNTSMISFYSPCFHNYSLRSPRHRIKFLNWLDLLKNLNSCLIYGFELRHYTNDILYVWILGRFTTCIKCVTLKLGDHLKRYLN